MSFVLKSPNKLLSKEAKTDNLSDLKDKKSNVVEISSFENEKLIVEQVATGATLATQAPGARFVIYDKENGSFEIKKNFEIDGKVYLPIGGKLTESGSLYLATEPIEYESASKLVKQIEKYLNRYFEVPKQFEKLLPNYILFTWVYDKFPFVPYLHFVGLTSTGKTTAGETIISLCYKGIDATGSASIASMFRIADLWRGTLFLDELDLQGMGAEGYHAYVSFLKSGVANRVVLRVEGEKSLKVNPYVVKAPKIFTSEKPITDAGLQSRTIVVKMEKNKRVLPLYKLTNYFEEGLELRNKLLMWRLRNLNKINLNEIEYGYDELKHLDRRVQQILTPIYHLSDERGKLQIAEFAQEQEEATKRERRDSLIGNIFTGIYDYFTEQTAQPPLKFVTDKINEEREEMNFKTRTSERKMGEIVRKELGFEVERLGHENISTIMVEKNLDKFNELASYFGLIPATPPPLASVASVADVASGAEKTNVDLDPPTSSETSGGEPTKKTKTFEEVSVEEILDEI